VVDVRVSDHQRIDRIRLDRKREPVPISKCPASLEQSAVHEGPMPVQGDKVARTRDGLSRAIKANRAHSVNLALNAKQTYFAGFAGMNFSAAEFMQ